jgi:2-hydroxycyclohexanecarboxyl-CoA dehydrogenase
VSDEAAVHAAFDEIEAKLGPASILVLNAGILPLVPLEETSAELWEQTLAINLTGAFFCARRALPGMRAAGYGRVVGLGAAAGKSGGARSAAYAASKAGLMTLVKSIAAEYARDGVTANVVAPALIDTQLLAATHEMAGRVPVGRLGTPEEVAAAVAFLVSSEAGYITGEVLDINGGTLID